MLSLGADDGVIVARMDLEEVIPVDDRLRASADYKFISNESIVM